jgi:isopenicillin N synthase-like dioxygenase
MTRMQSQDVIPVIDINLLRIGTGSQKADVAKQIDRACKNIGFFSVVGHGIPKELIRAAWEVTASYFVLPAEEKEKIPMTTEYPYGYSGVEEETLSKSRGDEFAPDLKEVLLHRPL